MLYRPLILDPTYIIKYSTRTAGLALDTYDDRKASCCTSSVSILRDSYLRLEQLAWSCAFVGLTTYNLTDHHYQPQLIPPPVLLHNLMACFESRWLVSHHPRIHHIMAHVLGPAVVQAPPHHTYGAIRLPCLYEGMGSNYSGYETHLPIPRISSTSHGHESGHERTHWGGV